MLVDTEAIQMAAGDFRERIEGASSTVLSYDGSTIANIQNVHILVLHQHHQYTRAHQGQFWILV